MNAFWVAAAALAGFLLPFQAAANAELGRQTPTLFHAAFINFLVGAALLGVLAIVTPAKSLAWTSLSQTPWWSWIGGVIGAGYVAMTVRAAPVLGTVVMLAVAIGGQMAGSLAADHVGFMGLAKRAMTWEKIVGMSLVAVGVLLILRRR
jgi:transporter family-2 protein